VTPCVDGGSAASSHTDIQLHLFTTKRATEEMWLDVDTVDIGYHYDPDYDEDVLNSITLTNTYCNTSSPNLLTIQVDFDDDETLWTLTITPLIGGDPVYTVSEGSGDITDEIDSIDWGEAETGTYVVTISARGGSSFTTFKFYVYLDIDDPDITILAPEHPSTVRGY